MRELLQKALELCLEVGQESLAKEIEAELAKPCEPVVRVNADIKFAREALRSVRYGVAWEGDPKRPTHKEMPDGYWAPWHVSDALIAELEHSQYEPLTDEELWKLHEVTKGEGFIFVSNLIRNVESAVLKKIKVE